VSGRRSYLDLLAKPFLPAANQTLYYFYDLNVKANYQVTEKDKVFLSLFKGRDNAQYTYHTFTQISTSAKIPKTGGAELFVKKNTGQLTGWIAYTLSKTDQTFAELNNGQTFPFAYDKRHNLSIVGTYELSKHWTISADFVFTTGGAFTMQNGRLAIDNGGSLFDGVYSDYVGRNNYRYNNYHRLDVRFSHKKSRIWFGKIYQAEWTFGDKGIIRIQTLDRNSATFFNLIDKQKLAQSNPFVEPAFLKTQIEGCIGIFGSYNISKSIGFEYPE
jgi:hypothetical protein